MIAEPMEQMPILTNTPPAGEDAAGGRGQVFTNTCAEWWGNEGLGE